MDHAAARDHNPNGSGRAYWRSLEELAETDAFQARLAAEFPSQASTWTDPAGRREFLRLMGASLALAGLSGCGVNAPEEIVPYSRAPENVVPGKPRYYATSVLFQGYAHGVIVESHMGRPTKIEGNPDHPASLGAADRFAQASILGLYDPDRSRAILRNGRQSSWSDFLGWMIDRRGRWLARKGEGLHVVTGPTTSPTLAAQLESLGRIMPEMRWYVHDPVGRENLRDGARLAFGRPLETVRDFAKADVVLSLDDDFLSDGPSHIVDARHFAARREPRRPLNRLYVVEPSPTITGAMADHRLPLAAKEIGRLAQALAKSLGVNIPTARHAADASWVARVAADLKSAKGRSIVTVGPGYPPEVHAIVHAINAALGNVGSTVRYIPSAQYTRNARTLVELSNAIDGGRVQTLLLLGVNPAYDAPANLNFAERMVDSVPERVHLGLYADETAGRCHWHVPEAHVLESWGDARAFDGTVSTIQPMIRPLFGGRSALEVLSILLGQPARTARETVTAHWKSQRGGQSFESDWSRWLDRGVIDGTAFEPVKASLKSTEAFVPDSRKARDGFEVLFRPDPNVWDGSLANNGWLQELPRPLTKLTWDNAALVSPKTAGALGVKNQDVVELKFDGRALRLPVWIAPGQAEESVTVHLGFGRTAAGRVGNGVGTSGYALRPSSSPWFGSGLKLAATGATHPLATTQHHQNMQGRDLLKSAAVGDFARNPRFVETPEDARTRGLTLFENPAPQKRRQEGEGNAWGMSINLNTCIGCNACVVACQAENNIPVVGKQQVINGREMHWIRIDRYYEGSAERPETRFQPVPCMHCENAPCELVCPVGATTHSAEGLNEMTYNRCVGTRYCSNNCPYKVRRFNFLEYNGDTSAPIALRHNPDVTVRSRGVMEKCTYCVQRINNARIAAEIEGRPIRDGEVVPACAQTCPTRAIVFGNLNDRSSEIARTKADPRNYALLEELNTRPRTTYLAKLTNPNPALEGA